MKDEKPVKTRKMSIREFMEQFPGKTIPSALTASGYLDEEDEDPMFNMTIMRNRKEGK